MNEFKSSRQKHYPETTLWKIEILKSKGGKDCGNIHRFFFFNYQITPISITWKSYKWTCAQEDVELLKHTSKCDKVCVCGGGPDYSSTT